MTLTAEPDILAAFVSRLRASTDIAALAATRVSAVLNERWTMPDYAIVVALRGGPPGRAEAGWRAVRVDLTCYGRGPNPGTRARTANELARVVNAYLCPTGGTRGFIAAHCAVSDVVQETGPIAVPEPQTRWAKSVTPYQLQYNAQPTTD